MNSEIKTAIILVSVIAVGIGVMSVVLSSVDEETTISDVSTNENSISKIDKSKFKKAPDLVGISNYLNITPEELKKEMKDKVILYDIWTYSCINCIRTLPYITAWDDKYADQGLLIIGIHSPEFEFEKDPKNVQMAIDKYGINYPVILDNDKKTWKAFENRYWPHKFLADYEGYIRYDRIGEGGYDETEKIIQELLQERATQLGLQTAEAQPLVDLDEFEHTRNRTQEMYFGYGLATGRSQLGSNEGFQPGKIVNYSEPEKIDLHKFYPIGDWENSKEGMKLESDNGIIKLRYTAKEVNIVTGNYAEMEIFVDGKPLTGKYSGSDITSGNKLIVSEPDLYNIISSENSKSQFMEIKIKGKGVQIFAFTFG